MEDIILKYPESELKVLIHYFHNQILSESTKKKGSFSFSDQFLKIKWEHSQEEEIFVKYEQQNSDILIYKLVDSLSDTKPKKNMLLLIHNNWQDLCVCFESIILRKSVNHNKGEYKIEELNQKKYLTVEWENWGKEIFIEKKNYINNNVINNLSKIYNIDFEKEKIAVYEYLNDNQKKEESKELIKHSIIKTENDIEVSKESIEIPIKNIKYISSEILNQNDIHKSNYQINLIHPSWKDRCFVKLLENDKSNFTIERVSVSNEKGHVKKILPISFPYIYEVIWEKWDSEIFIEWEENQFYHSSLIYYVEINNNNYFVNSVLEQIYYNNKYISCGLTSKECYLNHNQYKINSFENYLEITVNKDKNLIEKNIEPIHYYSNLKNALLEKQYNNINNNISNSKIFRNSNNKYLYNPLQQWNNFLFIIDVFTNEGFFILQQFISLFTFSETTVLINISETVFCKNKFENMTHSIKHLIVVPFKNKPNQKYIDSICKEENNESILYIPIDKFSIQQINILFSTNYPKTWDTFFYTSNNSFVEPNKLNLINHFKKMVEHIECLSDLVMFFILLIIFNRFREKQIEYLRENFIIFTKKNNFDMILSSSNSNTITITNLIFNEKQKIFIL